MTWTDDIRTGAIDVLAFYIPLTIIALSVARLPWEPLRVKLLYGELAAMALVFACVGFYQYETRQIFENAKLNVGNSYAAIFRVNSVFYDPSIYGRFLVVALVATAVVIVRGKSVRAGLAALAFAVVAWLGLLVSFSQSSFSALFVAVFCLCASSSGGGRRSSCSSPPSRSSSSASGRRAEAHALAAPPRRLRDQHAHERPRQPHLQRPADRKAASRRRRRPRRLLGGVLTSSRTGSDKHSASHNTPVTVAAEGGVIGLALFLWLVIAFGLVGVSAGRPNARRRRSGSRPGSSSSRSSSTRTRTTTSSRIRRRGSSSG